MLGGIFGRGSAASSNKQVIVQLDFTTLYGNHCGKDDFEEWKPASLESTCVLGKETTYWRRKEGSRCYIGNSFQPPKTTESICECSGNYIIIISLIV